MRMPGWNGVDVGEVLGSVTGLPFLIDNDANAMAVGEFIERGGEQEQLVFVKAGSGIGCGIILEGAVYRGFRGVAGDISHVALHNAPPIICSCGRVGCLDVVASGAAIVDALKEAGVAVETLDDVLALAQDAHPKATSALREAGARTGRCSPRSSTSSTRRRSRSGDAWPRRMRSSPACGRRCSRSACPCRPMPWRSASAERARSPAHAEWHGSCWSGCSTPPGSMRSCAPRRPDLIVASKIDSSSYSFGIRRRVFFELRSRLEA
ncbi:ROK family protein [Microbacterium sp. Se63.02b]|nr:ROK family protein [Microbacterium sp. Se63.02b]